MVRTQPREKRSVALIILVIIYALNSAGALAGGVMTIISLVSFAMMITDAGMDFPIVPLIVSIVAVLVIVGISITMTLSLYRRKRGAYIFHCVNVGFAILSAIALIALSTLAGAAFTSFLNELDPESTRDAAGAVSAIASSLGLVILCDGSVLLGLLALTVLSYDDFFGRMVRMSTAGLTSEGDTYNAGISYRNRGMWYMAAHEWELAAKSAPRDVTVWRALGLAYAQLKRYDQARDALSVALAMAPSDPQLTEDLVLVERLTAKR
ncbi:MAG: tetratricopeptide repeat protein [Chloroflexales bacterium]|nr:tetratricopeptide repeat protein [Chloroflexales bacterium]